MNFKAGVRWREQSTATAKAIVAITQLLVQRQDLKDKVGSTTDEITYTTLAGRAGTE